MSVSCDGDWTQRGSSVVRMGRRVSAVEWAVPPCAPRSLRACPCTSTVSSFLLICPCKLPVSCRDVSPCAIRAEKCRYMVQRVHPESLLLPSAEVLPEADSWSVHLRC